MKRILVSPSSFGEISSEPMDILKNHGYEVILNPYKRQLTEEEVIDLGEKCVGIVAGVEPLTKKVIDKLPDLKCISRVGVGIDNIDLSYARNRNIVIVNTPDGPTQAVAELTLGLAFSVLRKIPQAHHQMKQHQWKKQTGNLLLGKTVGIIGLGRIGRKVAEMFRSLGNPVVGYDIQPEIQWAKENNVQLTSLREVLEQADIISLHIPGTKDKSPLLGEKEIGYIKSSAILLNLSRGGIVDESALLVALQNGKIKGAALDVFNQEPYSGPLLELDNVVFTPHIGSYASESKLTMEIEAATNIINELNT